MQCPKCESQDVVRCSVAHAQGTTSTTMIGADNQGMFRANGKTAFASECAPPPAPGAFQWLFTGGFCLFCALVLYALVHFMIGDVGPLGTFFNGVIAVLLLITLASAWLLAKAIGQRPRHRAAMEHWYKQWVCLRCGEIFMPDQHA